MLTYDEALERILGAVEPLATELLTPSEALGRAIAGTIVARESLPSFDNSAVDGYALRLADWQSARDRPFSISQKIACGDPGIPDALIAGTAARIYTGAMVPRGADAILMQEDTELVSEGVILHEAPSAKFIRRAGSDVSQGQTVLTAGDIVDAGVVGLLSSLGIAEIACPARPRVGILSTGTELISASVRELPDGKIRDSNGPALEAAVRQAGGIVAARLHAADDENALRDAIRSLASCDVIVTSGGVSVGGADYVKEILTELGTLDFWRIAIKPGKPLAFGKIGESLFFGLPGNPVSSLVTFELFVRPVLKKLAGYREVLRPQIVATLTEALSHEPGRREFVRAHLEYRDGEALATPTGAQGSHRLSSMTGANCLLIAHEDREDYAAGERLPALLLI